MTVRSFIILAVIRLFMLAQPFAQAQGTQERERQTYAAVFAVRGSIVGSTISHFGPFVRTGDTSWHFLAMSNAFTFGFAAADYGSDRRLYWAGGDGLHRSSDGGATWRVLTGWQTMEVLSVVPHPVDPARLYISTPWGVYRSADDGRTWQPRNKGFRGFFTVLAGMDRRSPDHLYAMSDDDVYRTRNAGAHWTPLGVKGSVVSFAQHPVDPHLLLAGVEDGGIRRSADDGVTWNPTKGLDGATIYTITSSPDGKSLYAAGWQTGIWRSADDGKQWAPFWSAPGIGVIFCVYVDPRNPDHLLVGTDGQGIFESFDQGRQWRFAGLDGGKVKHIVIYP
jgi:photosystem II stability/assembly factor-like uncharacterized protein